MGPLRRPAIGAPCANSSKSKELMGRRDADAGSAWHVWAGPVLLIVTGAAMLRWTWLAWPDPLVDFGRELYVPWRLSEGAELYTDVAWFNGPLSQQWNAMLFRVLGPGLSVLVWSNVLVLAACVGMLYALTSRLADRLTGTVACMVFLLVFAFGQYVGIANYNWITPYSHEVTHGTALALATLVALDRWRRTGSVAALALGGLALGLCFLTKVETFLAGTAAGLVLLAPHARRREWRTLATFGGAALVPVVSSLVAHGPGGTLGAWPTVLAGEVGRLPFYQRGMGLDAPLRRLGEVLTMTGSWAAVWLPALALAWAGRGRKGFALPASAAALPLLAAAILGDRVPWLDILRPLPLAASALAAWLLVDLRRKDPDPRSLTGLAFVALAIVLSFKVFLRARAAHYGFALAMPATMLPVLALVGWAPAWLDRRGWRGDVLRAWTIACIAAFSLQHLSVTNDWLGRKTHVVGSGRDAFRSDVRGAFVQGAVDYLDAAPARSMAVLPEGVMINYLARVPNPTAYVNFMPPEEIVFGEEAWLAAFRRTPPDLILIVPKDTSEYGRGAFGTGYGRRLAEWVAAEYEPFRAIRVQGLAYAVQILVRR